MPSGTARDDVGERLPARSAKDLEKCRVRLKRSSEFCGSLNQAQAEALGSLRGRGGQLGGVGVQADAQQRIDPSCPCFQA